VPLRDWSAALLRRSAAELRRHTPDLRRRARVLGVHAALLFRSYGRLQRLWLAGALRRLEREHLRWLSRNRSTGLRRRRDPDELCAGPNGPYGLCGWRGLRLRSGLPGGLFRLMSSRFSRALVVSSRPAPDRPTGARGRTSRGPSRRPPAARGPAARARRRTRAP
jgi:hypothetical protein